MNSNNVYIGAGMAKTELHPEEHVFCIVQLFSGCHEFLP